MRIPWATSGGFGDVMPFTGVPADVNRTVPTAALAGGHDHRKVKAQQILVIKLGALGDFAHAFRAFAAIRAHHAADHITLLTTAPFRDVAEIAPWFDAVQIDPRAPWWKLPAIRRTTRLIGGFDFVYDLQNSRRTRRYIWLAGCPAWSGEAAGSSRSHANSRYGFVHTVDRQRKQLATAGIAEFPQPGCRWLTERGDLRGLTRPYALLMPGGAGAGVVKRWPVSGWATLARHLARRNILPVIIGGPAETDLAATIRQACRETNDLTARTSLADLAAIAANADVAVGNDTGPLHLAAFVGAPTVVLFSGAGLPAQAAPLGPGGEWPIILQMPNLADLSAERVMAAVDATLASRGPWSRSASAMSPTGAPLIIIQTEPADLSSQPLLEADSAGEDGAWHEHR
jgi:ADP-heptose:LPS heptosyltransferase